jgi:tRNA(Ile)-lysidine synthase
MLRAMQSYLRKHGLIQPGERIGVAVSGGADSVALLQALHELRPELGVVLSVVHFNHRIRGADSDADERFVRKLAQSFELEMFAGSGDAPATALQNGESLETAARGLRYAFFAQVIEQNKLDKIAVAHNQDDQAETVLMRFLRGAGTKGLAGIYPSVELGRGRIVRPLLEVSRAEIETYLRSKSQGWREDATNEDLVHTRNKVRRELLPQLKEFNPSIVEALARTAEVARGEEEYWQGEVNRLLPMVLLPGKATRGGGRAAGNSLNDKSSGLDIEALRRHPLALQRRLIRAATEVLAIKIDAMHVETVLSVAAGQISAYELPGGWRVKRSLRELRFERSQVKAAAKSPKQN